jgi:macrolide-specific efflux system membrane fusion protein
VAGLGGSTSGGSPPIIVLGDPANLVVGAAFPSSDEPELAVGQSGTITDASLNGLSVPCHVIAIAPSPTTVGGTSVIYATVKPDTSTKDLYTGMAVSVDITVSQAVRVLAVPQSAIYLVSGIPHADVWDGGRAIATVVSTGVQGTTLIEVTSGLTAGQQVVLSAYQGLTQGTNGSGSS